MQQIQLKMTCYRFAIATVAFSNMVYPGKIVSDIREKNYVLNLLFCLLKLKVLFHSVRRWFYI